MTAILKNTTGSLKTWGGIDINALSSYNMQLVDTLRMLSDETFKTDLTSGDAVINDGFNDLAPVDAVFFLFAYTPNTLIGGTDGTPIGNNGDRLKLDVLLQNDAELKVSSNDQTSGYLEQKIVGSASEISVSTLNDGGDEDLQVGLSNFGTAGTYGSTNQIPVLTTDAKGRVQTVVNTPISITSSEISNFTEDVQDAIGSSLADTSSIDFTYNDAGNTISAVVLPSGVDHAALTNLNSATYSHLTSTQLTDLTDSGDSTLHFHSSDRDRTNHTGTQVASTISDFTEASQDAIGTALTDTASIDFTYNDVANTISAAVLPAGVDHNSLANLTTGDPHTQYVKGPASATDNAIARYDSTTGKLIQNSAAFVDDNGGIISGDLIRPGNTSDTTTGNIRLNSGEVQLYDGTVWRVIATTPVVVSATGDTSTTSAAYAVINTMTQTPAAGTYMCFFTCTAALASDTTADIAIFVNGTEDTTSTRRLAINASGGTTGTFEVPVCIITEATVTGAQAIDVRFRENGAGTLTVGPRRLKVIAISR